MKKILLICLLLVSISSFSQETRNTLTLKEIIFLGSFDNTNKIVQTSTDGKTNRTLMKINTDNAEEPMIKYMLLENNEEGTAIGSSYILSKKAINNETDFFKFNINSYDVIYNDPELIKANEENNGKNISIGLKHAGKPIDLGTIPDNYAIASCENGSAPYCIDWYWQTFENGILISEEYQYTTCKCGGGGSGIGIIPYENLCTTLDNESLGFSTNQINSISYEYDEASPLSKRGSYIWKCHTAGNWWFNSFESSSLTKEIATDPWAFESLSHTSNSSMQGHITNGLAAEMRLHNATPTYVTQSTAKMDLDYEVVVKCIDPGMTCTRSKTYPAYAIFSSGVNKMPIFSVPGIQQY